MAGPAAVIPRQIPRRYAEVWVTGVALGLFLGILSSGHHAWSTAVMLVAVVAAGGIFVRALGVTAGVLVLLIVSNLADHFTYPVGSLDLRAEQAAMAVALVAVVATGVRRRGLAVLRPSVAEVLLVGWLAISALSSLVESPDRALSVKVLVLIAICTLGFALPRRLLVGQRDTEQLEEVVRWLLIALATEAAYGTFAYLLHALGPSISIGPNPASGHLEAYGTLWEQNVFGAFAAAGAVGWVYLGPSRFRHAWIGLAASMGGLVDSLTRAAWLAAAAVGALGLILPGLRRRLDMLVVGTGLLGGLLAAAAVLVADTLGTYTVHVSGGARPAHTGLFGAILNMTDFIGRINQLAPVWSDIKGTTLLIGRGTASFEALHVDKGVPEHVASLPLLILNDTGVLGLAVFAAFLFAVVRRGWSRRRDERVVGLGQMAIVIGLANLATQTTELMIGWLMLGILMAAADLAPAASSGTNQRDARASAA